MNTLKTIERTNVTELEVIGVGMAAAYQEAFAEAPWYEASRCNNAQCDTLFSPLQPGCACMKCGGELEQAYPAEELIDGWAAMVENEDAIIELALSEEAVPLRATIARPTDPNELIARKYPDMPGMAAWAAEKLPSELVWIEDTFANLQLSPRGNLQTRAQTLGMLAMRFTVPLIATRTLAPAIVRSTIRDVAGATDVYLGTERAGESLAFNARSVGKLPDRRTFLAIDATELRA